jgi:hypothetical protein
MKYRIGIAILGFLAVMFVLSAFARIASAQDSDMMNDPGETDLKMKVPPISVVTGFQWCGPQTDNKLGSMGFFIKFEDQNKYKLTGTWSSDVPGFQKDKTGFPGGTFTGKISKTDGETFSLKLIQKGIKGGFVLDGHFISSTELTGSYLSFGRRDSDSGTVDPSEPCS